MLDSIFTLQSQTKSIRMAQASQSGLGPLDGLANDLNTKTSQTRYLSTNLRLSKMQSLNSVGMTPFQALCARRRIST